VAETTSTQGVLDAAGDYVRLSVAGLGGVAFQIQGSFSGTVTFEASLDGQSFHALRVTPSSTTTAVTTATTTGLWTGSATGYLAVQARMSAYTSGSATLLIRSDAASPGGASGGGGAGSDVNLIEVGGAAVALGQGVSAASIPVVLPSDFSGMAVTVANGADVALGATTDATVQGNNTGSVSARLRGISVVLNDVWDDIGNFLKVSIQNATLAVTQSGAWTVAVSTVTTITNAVTVSQATAASLNATVVGTGTFAVQDAAAEASLSVLDDWDESDRAKVNPIVGQAGVAAGSGTVGATTQRVTLATDVALPAGTNNIGDIDVLTLPAKRQYVGTAQTVINTATDIAASNFSGAPSATYDNTTDGSYPYAPYALAMLEAPDWAAAPVAGTTVDLYGVILNVDSTDDETDAPSGTSAGGAHWFGSWTIAAADALQRRQIVINMQGVLQVDFYIRNGTAQNMNNDGGTNCVVKVTPLSCN
jgi:hypothetical protein